LTEAKEICATFRISGASSVHCDNPDNVAHYMRTLYASASTGSGSRCVTVAPTPARPHPRPHSATPSPGEPSDPRADAHADRLATMGSPLAVHPSMLRHMQTLESSFSNAVCALLPSRPVVHLKMNFCALEPSDKRTVVTSLRNAIGRASGRGTPELDLGDAAFGVAPLAHSRQDHNLCAHSRFPGIF
jgi:hypothetical protein